MMNDKPIAWMIPGAVTLDASLAKANGNDVIPLYKKAEWQGLTDEERDEVSKDYGPLSGGEWTLMLLVEQALKEKNT
jgi:hypothetical protein